VRQRVNDGCVNRPAARRRPATASETPSGRATPSVASNLLPPLPAPADNAAMESEPTKADPPKRKRRWFQFSLRSLMIGVTLFCLVVGGYIGSQVKTVRDRKSWLEEHKRAPMRGDLVVSTGDESKSPNAIRRWFGDEAIRLIALPPDEDNQMMKKLFPEAIILQTQLKPKSFSATQQRAEDEAARYRSMLGEEHMRPARPSTQP
jgi:hypothetical protein